MISGKYIRGLLILAFLLTTIKVNAQIKSDYPFPVNYLALKAQQNTYRMAYMLDQARDLCDADYFFMEKISMVHIGKQQLNYSQRMVSP